MAIGAFGGSEAVKDHGFTADRPSLRMALVTGHIGMSPGQRKGSAFIVIESRRRPPFRVVAVRAMRFVVLGELPGMHIGVTNLAGLGRSFEDSFVSAGRNQMARTAGRPRDARQQWKLGFRMIETFRIDPGVHVMASLAAQRRTVSALLSHACLELAVVRVRVTSGATAILEMKG